VSTRADDKQLAKDVAKQLDRRRLRRRVLFLAAFVGAIVIAVLYLTCGRGWGIGGAGKGEGSGPGTATPVTDAGPRRCAIRVTATGLVVDGKPATRDVAVTTCKGTDGADVVITGDARQGDWDDLRAALEAAGVPIFTKQR
jgi:hypothetical protein